LLYFVITEKSVGKDSVAYETEKLQYIDKRSTPSTSSSSPHPQSQSSSTTPLLFASNVQSYQQPQPVLEQLQQKSVTASPLLSANSGLSDLDNDVESEEEESRKFSHSGEFIVNIDELAKSGYSSFHTNPFFDSHSLETVRDENSSVSGSLQGEKLLVLKYSVILGF
jgi:hypothetical protein